MTAETHIERIRQALAKGPTPGPWAQQFRGSIGSSNGNELAVVWFHDDASKEAENTATTEYISACNPEALTAILADHARLTEALAAAQKDAERYRWLRDCNDWYAEPRLDEEDFTKWELVMYSPQRITDPSDDDNLDAAIDAAMKESTNG